MYSFSLECMRHCGFLLVCTTIGAISVLLLMVRFVPMPYLSKFKMVHGQSPCNSLGARDRNEDGSPAHGVTFLDRFQGYADVIYPRSRYFMGEMVFEAPSTSGAKRTEMISVSKRATGREKVVVSWNINLQDILSK